MSAYIESPFNAKIPCWSVGEDGLPKGEAVIGVASFMNSPDTMVRITVGGTEVVVGARMLRAAIESAQSWPY